MTAPSAGPRRVRAAHVEWLQERCSPRDWAIITTTEQLRLVTGSQLERLHFMELMGRSRSVTRWRVLQRLVAWRVLLPLERRVGGSLRGSAELVFALDSAGLRLLQLRANEVGVGRPVRRPGVPGERLVRHTLAVSELHVRLTERARGGEFDVSSFLGEPACWCPDGRGGWLKPDAHIVLRTTRFDEHIWLEVDLATESLPALRRQLLAYVSFVQRGQVGPAGIVPRVLVTVPSDRRCEAVARVIAGLPKPADELLMVSRYTDAVAALAALTMTPNGPSHN